jgi:hypothetical protein
VLRTIPPFERTRFRACWQVRSRVFVRASATGIAKLETAIAASAILIIFMAQLSFDFNNFKNRILWWQYLSYKWISNMDFQYTCARTRGTPIVAKCPFFPDAGLEHFPAIIARRFYQS